jgi:hypothetical protein
VSKGIPIERGETLNLVLELFQTDEDGLPINLVGATVDISDSTFPAAAQPVLLVTNAPGGKMVFRLSAAETNQLVVGRSYQCKIRITDTAGNVQKHPDDPMVFFAK